MRDFMMAALPLVVAGIALAVFFAGRAEKKKTQEKKNDYEAIGMSLGMCFGGRRWRHYPGVHRRHPVCGDAHWAGHRNVFREEA